MRPAGFRPEAEADLDEAVDWYESQQSGLGAAFLEESARVASRIGSSPSHFPVVYRGTRRALLRRFPYAMFFRTDDEQSLIVAVADLRRSPDHWRRRVDV